MSHPTEESYDLQVRVADVLRKHCSGQHLWVYCSDCWPLARALLVLISHDLPSIRSAVLKMGYELKASSPHRQHEGADAQYGALAREILQVMHAAGGES